MEEVGKGEESGRVSQEGEKRVTEASVMLRSRDFGTNMRMRLWRLARKEEVRSICAAVEIRLRVEMRWGMRWPWREG